MENTTVISYNVTAVPQVNPDQIGPQYLLTGLTDVGYRYEEGLAYNWYGDSGFTFFYNVFGPDGSLVFPEGQAGSINFNGPVHPYDKIVLYMYLNKGKVIMIAEDWNTSAYVNISSSSLGAHKFLGNTKPGTQNFFFTGLMTEWLVYNAQNLPKATVEYTPYVQTNSPVRLWILDSKGYFASNRYIITSFTNASSMIINHDNQYILRSGDFSAKFYGGSFYTGSVGLSPFTILSSNTPNIISDSNLNCSVNVSVHVTGGKFPYNYLVLLDQTVIDNSTTQNTTFVSKINCKGLSAGTHLYYLKISDASRNGTVTQIQSIKINPPMQALNYSPRLSSSFFLINDSYKASVSVQGGTSPYNYSWYVGNSLQFTTSNPNSSLSLRAGTNNVKLVISDALGATYSTSNLVRTDYNYLNILYLIIVILLIVLIYFLVNKYWYNREEYYYTSDEKNKAQDLDKHRSELEDQKETEDGREENKQESLMQGEGSLEESNSSDYEEIASKQSDEDSSSEDSNKGDDYNSKEAESEERSYPNYSSSEGDLEDLNSSSSYSSEGYSTSFSSSKSEDVHNEESSSEHETKTESESEETKSTYEGDSATSQYPSKSEDDSQSSENTNAEDESAKSSQEDSNSEDDSKKTDSSQVEGAEESDSKNKTDKRFSTKRVAGEDGSSEEDEEKE